MIQQDITAMAAEVLGGVGAQFVPALLGFLGALALFRGKFQVYEERHAALATKIAEDKHAAELNVLSERAHDKELARIGFDSICSSVAEMVKTVDERGARMERRQGITLELTASIARKMGVTHRAIGTDAFAELLTEED